MVMVVPVTEAEWTKYLYDKTNQILHLDQKYSRKFFDVEETTNYRNELILIGKNIRAYRRKNNLYNQEFVSILNGLSELIVSVDNIIPLIKIKFTEGE